MLIAIDIGATKTLIALFSEHGRCLKRIKFLTNKNFSSFQSELLKNLKPFEKKKISSVIVAVPAIVEKNCSFSPENLPWKNVNLLPELKSLFRNSRISVLNDADLATLFESGPYKGKTIYLTFSTGIGGGLAKDGIVLKTSATFEPGHKLYHFGDSDREWEDLASAKALKRLFRISVRKIEKSSSFETIAFRLSLGLSDIINHYHPDTIIIGGPLAHIFNHIHPYLINYLFDSVNSLPDFKKAKRPEESVIYGCYLYGKFH